VRITYFTDPHFRASRPLRRKDDWVEASLGKLLWICDRAVASRSDLLICGGDLFDSPAPSFEIVSRVQAALGSTGIRTLLVVGNHDISGRNHENWRRGPLSVLVGPGSRIEVAPPRLELAAVDLFFWHYEHGIDSRVEYEVPRRPGIPAIGVAHSMIVGPGDEAHFGSVPADKVVTNLTLMLCAHYHPGFETWGDGQASTVFTAPGALTRTSSSDAGREPKIVEISVDGSGMEVEEVVVPHAPAGEVLDLERAALDREWSSTIEEFVRGMESVAVRSRDVRRMVRDFAEACESGRVLDGDGNPLEVRPEVVELVLDRIDRYRAGDE